MTLLPEEAFLWLWLVLSVVAAIVVVRALRLPVIWVVYPPCSTASSRPTRMSSFWRSWLSLERGRDSCLGHQSRRGPAAPGRTPLARAPAGSRGHRCIGGSVSGYVVVLPASGRDGPGHHQCRIRGRPQCLGQAVSVHPDGTLARVLALFDGRAAGWLVVPALFPTTQYYYAMFALPVDPFLAAVMAFPVAWMARSRPSATRLSESASSRGAALGMRPGLAPRFSATAQMANRP